MSGAEAAKQKHMWDHAAKVRSAETNFDKMEALELHPDIREAIEWQAQRSPEEVVDERERMVAAIETADRWIRESGKSEAWLADSPAEIKKLCANVNGSLFYMLAEATNYPDLAAIDFLRKGMLL